MIKILYIMHVDWDWIKQRPHFLVEGLSKKYDITILYQYSRNREGLQNNNRNGLTLNAIKSVPGIGRIALIKIINDFLMKLKIKKYIKKINPEIIYLTYPNQINWISKGFEGKVIYDCMDYHAGFYKNERERSKVLADEKRLCHRADLVLTSSERLANILSKNNLCENIEVVRNGYNGEIIDLKLDNDKNENYIFGYFGTISSWFNFDYITKSLSEFENIEYWLMGPIEKGINIPNHDRLKYKGVIEHSLLYEETKKVNCFIMPFMLNDLILSVDPVKLYEYINFDRQIMTIYYDEIKRFDKYVWFYENYETYRANIEKLISSNEKKYSENDRMILLKNNTWQCRVDQISKKINEMF